jgi:AcrR family transcriptional regulator
MEEYVEKEAVRERLIIAGIRELEEHGLNDFSLRRVALTCDVSCAAPYRHFKSKDDLILAIIRYINRQWMLLEEQIVSAFPNNARKQVIEIAIANVRFWIANPNFRSVLLQDPNTLNSVHFPERREISERMTEMIHRYCQQKDLTAEREKIISFSVRSIIYGAVLLLGNGDLENTPETIRMLRSRIEQELPY